MSQNGKGSRDRVKNKSQFDENYSQINWSNKLSCLNCNYLIDKEHVAKYPDLYMVYSDKEVEHKICNFL